MVTREQYTLLALMFDTAHPLVERAQAGRHLAEVGDPRPGVGDLNLQWCYVPAGQFLFGTNSRKDRQAFDDDIPQTRVTLPAFRIGKYPVTYAQYKMFIAAPDGYANTAWWQGLAQRKAAPGQQRFSEINHPVDTVSWYDAMAFCRWMSVKMGYEVRLPTEQEWEKAARGTDGRIYPYGNRFDAAKGNTSATELMRTSAVGLFVGGSSPYGVLDMSGNVWQWTLTEYQSRESNDLTNSHRRVMRGGSFHAIPRFARAACRGYDVAGSRSLNVGFRLVSAPR